MTKKNNRIIFLSICVLFVIFNTTHWNRASANSINATVELVNEQTFTIDTTQSVSGTITNSNGTSLQFSSQAGALSSGIGIRMIIQAKSSASITPTKPVPTDKTISATVYEISLEKTSDSSPVLLVDEAITLTFTYTETDTVGIDENTIRVYRWSGSSWVILTDSLVDVSTNIVTASSLEFGNTFALLGSAPVVTESGDTTSSNSGGGSISSSRLLNRLFPFLFPTPTPSYPSQQVDFNGDRKVDVVDLSILLYRWGETGPDISRYDMNADGQIDLVDISVLFFYWTS